LHIAALCYGAAIEKKEIAPMSLQNVLLADERQSQASHNYVEYHRQRFSYIIQKCKELCPDRKTRVLDIGYSRLSYLLLEVYDNVTTLGFPLSGTEQHDREAAPPLARGCDVSRGISYST
jgi:hypothetical protein